MPEPPRRKRFQFHLSTAIVMMFVAGGLMWANTTAKIAEEGTFNESHVNWTGTFVLVQRGWPFPYCQLENWQYSDKSRSPIRNPDPKYYFSNALLNMLIAMIIVSLGLFLCESRIRRRAARKGV